MYVIFHVVIYCFLSNCLSICPFTTVDNDFNYFIMFSIILGRICLIYLKRSEAGGFKALRLHTHLFPVIHAPVPKSSDYDLYVFSL